MNLLTISSLSSFKENPRITELHNVQITVLLYKNNPRDKKSVNEIKKILKCHNYQFHSKKNLTHRQIYESSLFHNRCRQDWLVFPSIYMHKNTDKGTKDVVYVLKDKAVTRKNIHVIPVVYDSHTFRLEGDSVLRLHKTLSLSGDSTKWWEKLEQILGRPSGHVHVVLAEDITDDTGIDEHLQGLVDFIKSEVSPLNRNEQKDMLIFLRDELDLIRMIEDKTLSHSPATLKKYPSTTKVNQTFEENDLTKECTSTTTHGPLRSYDATAFTDTSMKVQQQSNFMQLNKEVHIVYQDQRDSDSYSVEERDTLSLKVKDIKDSLAKQGYKVKSKHDIPLGENIHGIEDVLWHQKRIATIVIDFDSLDSVTSHFAELDFLQTFYTEIKFISLSLHNTEPNRRFGNMNTLDISGDHSEWFPKLEKALSNSRRHAASAVCENDQSLKSLQQSKLYLKTEMDKLSPEIKETFLTKILADSELRDFLAQPTHLQPKLGSDSVIFKDKKSSELGQYLSSSESSINTTMSHSSNRSKRNTLTKDVTHRSVFSGNHFPSSDTSIKTIISQSNYQLDGHKVPTDVKHGEVSKMFYDDDDAAAAADDDDGDDDEYDDDDDDDDDDDGDDDDSRCGELQAEQDQQSLLNDVVIDLNSPNSANVSPNLENTNKELSDHETISGVKKIQAITWRHRLCTVSASLVLMYVYALLLNVCAMFYMDISINDENRPFNKGEMLFTSLLGFLSSMIFGRVSIVMIFGLSYNIGTAQLTPSIYISALSGYYGTSVHNFIRFIWWHILKRVRGTSKAFLYMYNESMCRRVERYWCINGLCYALMFLLFAVNEKAMTFVGSFAVDKMTFVEGPLYCTFQPLAEFFLRIVCPHPISHNVSTTTDSSDSITTTEDPMYTHFGNCLESFVVNNIVVGVTQLLLSPVSVLFLWLSYKDMIKPKQNTWYNYIMYAFKYTFITQHSSTLHWKSEERLSDLQKSEFLCMAIVGCNMGHLSIAAFTLLIVANNAKQILEFLINFSIYHGFVWMCFMVYLRVKVRLNRNLTNCLARLWQPLHFILMIISILIFLVCLLTY